MSKRANGEGSVYKQAYDGRWVAALTLPNGTRRRFTASTQADALKKRKDWEQRNEGLPAVADERLTLERFLKHWLAMTRENIRPATYRGYESKLRIHVLPELGNRRLTGLSVQMLEAFFAQKAKDGLSPRTVHHLRAILRAALNDAVKWNLARRNPASIADTPRIPEAEPLPMGPDEAKAIVAGVEADRLGPLYIVALASGLRQGELLGLRWQDVDLDAGTLAVRMALQRIDHGWHLGEPKTRSSRRIVSIPDLAKDALRKQHARQLEEQIAAGPEWANSRNLVFTTAAGQPLQGGGVSRRLHELLALAGLPDRRFHDLRHGYASLLLAQGVQPRVIMAALGHTQLSTTMTIYAHVIPALEREAADRMQAMLG